MSSPLDTVLSGGASSFALLHRPHTGVPGMIDVLTGPVTRPAQLLDIQLPPGPADRHESLVLIPYRQITERGFTAHDDGTPLISMKITAQHLVPVAEVSDRITAPVPQVTGGRFDTSDEQYADLVERIISEEIGSGSGSNFVIRRSFLAEIPEYRPASALPLFRRLLAKEQGAYWTFLIYTGERTLLGASPERHVSLRDEIATMNPISGTYRYPDGGPTLDDLAGFLADDKEIDELHMVLDEELKMMARICAPGVRVSGPQLREMAKLAHTEYFIQGRSTRDVRDILRETMFAPTVVGSPLKSAARVIHRNETRGRGYYSGVAALIGRDAEGKRTLDSAILIRTAEIDQAGRVDIGVGATLVRHSDPAAEAAETHAKVASIQTTLLEPANLAEHPSVRTALRERSDELSSFWRAGTAVPREAAGLSGLRVIIIDAEDMFTSMIAHQLDSLGLKVEAATTDQLWNVQDYDLVVLGPGPGDPRSADPRIVRLREVLEQLLAQSQPFLAVCLSHQLLAIRLGLPLQRRAVPAQGEQRNIELFGREERVGFYNTYVAVGTEERMDAPGLGSVEVSLVPATGEVHALRGLFFASLQFHAESVLTIDGPRILAATIAGVVGR